MRLGIDPGIANTGWAIIDKRYVESGVITTPTNYLQPARLHHICGTLQNIVQAWPIKTVIIETLYGRGKSVHATAELIGVIDLLLWREGYHVHRVPPSVVKKQIGVSGHAKKPIVAARVAELTGVDVSRMKSHETDAIAIALGGTNAALLRV